MGRYQIIRPAEVVEIGTSSSKLKSEEMDVVYYSGFRRPTQEFLDNIVVDLEEDFIDEPEGPVAWREGSTVVVEGLQIHLQERRKRRLLGSLSLGSRWLNLETRTLTGTTSSYIGLFEHYKD